MQALRKRGKKRLTPLQWGLVIGFTVLVIVILDGIWLWEEGIVQNWGPDATQMKRNFAEGFGLLSALFSGLALAGLVSIGLQIDSARQTARIAHYGELERMYAELLRLGIDKPYLRDLSLRARPKQGDAEGTTLVATQVAEYHTYAYMVWNFVEAVIDRLADLPDEHLKATWEPVIGVENRLHREWFKNHAHYFKPGLTRAIDEVVNGLPKPARSETDIQSVASQTVS